MAFGCTLVAIRPNSRHIPPRGRPTPLIFRLTDFVHCVTPPQLGIDCDKASVTLHERTGNFGVVGAGNLCPPEEQQNGDGAEKHDKILESSGGHEIPPQQRRSDRRARILRRPRLGRLVAATKNTPFVIVMMQLGAAHGVGPFLPSIDLRRREHPQGWCCEIDP
jgi:hypothetical protein